MAATVSANTAAVRFPARPSGRRAAQNASKSNARYARASGRQMYTAATISANMSAANGTPNASHWP